MPINLPIPDNELAGFSDPARVQVEDAVRNYATDLIREANRIEAGRNSANGPPEVTKAMVYDANDLLRRGFGTPKNHLGLRVVRILAALLSLAVGIMYDPTLLQSQAYLLVFILVVTATIVAVTISTLRD